MNDDLNGRLEQWGSQSPPSPDPAFTDRLENDLRSQAYFSRESGMARTRRAPLLRPAMLLGSAAVVLVGAWFVLQSAPGPAEEVVMSQASDTQVLVPGQSPIQPDADMTLPDGTRITVDDAGSAVVDGVVLGGGTQAVVENGRIEVFAGQATATPIAATPATATPASTPVAIPPAGTPEAEPIPTPVPTVAPDPTAAPTAAPTSQPTSEPSEPTPFDILLEIEVVSERRALLRWTAAPRDDLAGWEVLVIDGDRERSLALLRDPAVRELQIERTSGTVYMVRARAGGGLIIDQSNLVDL